MILEIPNAEAMEQLGSKLVMHAQAGCKIYLQGELGAGKTTLVRGFLRGLGHTGVVKSPTYTLIETYALQGHRIYHFDLYRLNTPEELEAIGLRDYFDGQGISLLEWPEKAEQYLPEPDLWLLITYNNTQRQVQLFARTASGATILEHLN